MFAALAGGLGSLARTLAPTAINWGMKKLANTGIGRLVRPALPAFKHLLPDFLRDSIQVQQDPVPLLNMTQTGPMREQQITQWIDQPEQPPVPIKRKMIAKKKQRRR